MEVLIGDLCGIFIWDNNDPNKWIIWKRNRCDLMDEIITQSQTPKNVREAALLDAQCMLYRLILPRICAHAALHRISK